MVIIIIIIINTTYTTVRCPLCSWFAAKSFKVILGHMGAGAVHAHDPAFYISCAASGCP